MTADNTHVLSTEQLGFYKEHGYLHLRGAVSEATLARGQDVFERWVDAIAARWQDEGLISERCDDEPFNRRLLALWRAAGEPRYSRSPRKELVGPEMFEILRAPEFLDIAQDLLGSREISAHGIWNGRPKLPSQSWTDTPWHQDAQYFRDAEHVHVPTFWFPLQDVTTENSCLQVASGLHDGPLHEAYSDTETGFIGLAPDVQSKLQGIPIEMTRGDLLVFTQTTPHGALPNRSDAVRWSMDTRYECTDQATQGGRELGFVARSERAPESVSDYEAWKKKWDAHPNAY